ncbi:MAG: hypothetical protein ACK47B_23075 [Armatimonadota bacterium]
MTDGSPLGIETGGIARSSAEPASGGLVSPLIRQLCQQLESREIRYCHWKSNWRAQRWAGGEGDLDLLVGRSDWLRFTALLSELGFRQVVSPGALVPGIQHYYGLDVATDQFVHVHAHSQLVVGHDLSKNFHVPLEEAFVASARPHGLLCLPAPELELILYVVRMVLKYSAVELWSRKGGLSASVYQEYLWLAERADPDQVLRLLDRHLPGVGPELFRECVDSLHPRCSNWARLAIRQRLIRRLQAHARQPLLLDSLVRFGRRLQKLARNRLPRRGTRKLLSNGGAMVALLGGDGAGKTSAADGLHRWISKTVATRRIHLGKPPRSLSTQVVALLARGTRLLNERKPAAPADTGGLGAGDYLQMLRYVCVARDRVRLYTEARRFATAGGLVICDRFPCPQIKQMDGPKIARFLNGRAGGRLAGWLADRERSYYARMLAPEVVIALTVDPETAVARKPQEDPEQVRSRSREFRSIDWEGLGVPRIDTSRSAEEVLTELKGLLWARI